MNGVKQLALMACDGGARLGSLLCERPGESDADRAARLAQADKARADLDALLGRLESLCGAARRALSPPPEPEAAPPLPAAPPPEPTFWQRLADRTGETLLVLSVREDCFGNKVPCLEYAVAERDAEPWQLQTVKEGGRVRPSPRPESAPP